MTGRKCSWTATLSENMNSTVQVHRQVSQNQTSSTDTCSGTLKPFPRHLMPEWLNYNTQQKILSHGADWSSWNCNLDSYFYAISFVNDADSAAFSFWIAAAWKQALLLFSLYKWQHNHNALQNSKSWQVGKTVTAPEWEAAVFCRFLLLCPNLLPLHWTNTKPTPNF